MTKEIKNIAQYPPIPIVLKEVEKRPGPFCMSFMADLAPLIESIQKVGIVNPPILVRNDRKMFDVVAGYRRIQALNHLGSKEAQCIVLPDPEFSPLDCIHLALYENCLIRNFNDVEKSMILRRLEPFVQKKTLLQQYMPILKLPFRESVLNLYLMLECLELPLLESLARETLSLHSIRSMLELTREDRLILNQWIANLKLNNNYQKYFIEYVTDISFKNQINIADFFNDKTLKNIFMDRETNIPQKSKRLLSLLREMRYPRLTKAEKNFKKEVSRLCLPDGVKITAPHNFEGIEYSLEIKFDDGGTLAKKISEISLTLESLRVDEKGFLEYQ